jgi:hypothetical protein
MTYENSLLPRVWELERSLASAVRVNESLRQQLASRDAEVAELKESLRLACEIREGTTMGEQRLAYWLQLQSDNDQLREQVTLLRSLVPKRIPDGFVSFGKYYSEQEDKFNEPYNSMCKFKRKYLSDCEEALAATADIDGLILCHAEPVRYIYEYPYWDGSSVWRDKPSFDGVNANKSMPLYRAWEPK